MQYRFFVGLVAVYSMYRKCWKSEKNTFPLSLSNASRVKGNKKSDICTDQSSKFCSIFRISLSRANVRRISLSERIQKMKISCLALSEKIGLSAGDSSITAAHTIDKRDVNVIFAAGY